MRSEATHSGHYADVRRVLSFCSPHSDQEGRFEHPSSKRPRRERSSCRVEVEFRRSKSVPEWRFRETRRIHSLVSPRVQQMRAKRSPPVALKNVGTSQALRNKVAAAKVRDSLSLSFSFRRDLE